MLEPLPCPFCGDTPEIEHWHGGGPNKTAVHCINEDCHARPMVTGEGRKTAIKVWNTRSPA